MASYSTSTSCQYIPESRHLNKNYIRLGLQKLSPFDEVYVTIRPVLSLKSGRNAHYTVKN